MIKKTSTSNFKNYSKGKKYISVRNIHLLKFKNEIYNLISSIKESHPLIVLESLESIKS